MKDKVFLDTNIIVYAHDLSSVEKNAVSKEIIDHLWESKKGVILLPLAFSRSDKNINIIDLIK